MANVKPRIAIIGASHWHAPMYLKTLADYFDIALVWDRDARLSQEIANRCGAHSVSAFDRIQQGGVEVAVVLGRHGDMFPVGMHLAKERIPFLIEKPASLNLSELTALSIRAAEQDVPVTVPLVHRWGPVADALHSVRHPRYFSATYIVGPPERYVLSGNEWMVHVDTAGGGPLVNIGVHFVDLFLELLGEREVIVKASMQRSMHTLEIEDHATVLLETPSGASGVIEVGYNFPISPAKRFARFSLAGDDGLLSVGPDGRQTFTAVDGSRRERWIDVDSDPLFARFLALFAASLGNGFAGLPTLDELVVSMRLVERAYVDAGFSTGTGATWAS